jgi:hypothetical protein
VEYSTKNLNQDNDIVVVKTGTQLNSIEFTSGVVFKFLGGCGIASGDCGRIPIILQQPFFSLF